MPTIHAINLFAEMAIFLKSSGYRVIKEMPKEMPQHLKMNPFGCHKHFGLKMNPFGCHKHFGVSLNILATPHFGLSLNIFKYLFEVTE